MRRLVIGVVVAILSVLIAGGAVSAEQPAATTFVVVLNSAEETGTCHDISNSARGVAVFHVTDEATGTVEWKLVANNLPGTTFAAHIHLAPKNTPGPIVQPLPITPGSENGVIGTGMFTNKALLTAIRANPQLYYVNVHTVPNCPGGVIRGQFGDHGP